MTLYGGTGIDQEWAYEYMSPEPEQCPDLPYFWGPSSNGSLTDYGSGCPDPEEWNCNLGLLADPKNKWCYRYRHITPQGSGCDYHTDYICHGNVDLDDKWPGVVGDDDVDELADLLGTECGSYVSGPKYNPVADFNKDGYIDASDLALLAQHYEHKCSDWQSTGHSKVTSSPQLPWHVFDSPAMQRAMARAGIDRDFVVRIWELNGPGQLLFARGETYNREQHLAALISQPGVLSSSVRHDTWGNVKVLYR
jgi:hypothetical protein